MLKGSSGVSFSVVFFDGESTLNVGEVTVDSSMNFKNFQSDLGQKIGVSPHQLSVYLGSPERHKTHKESRHDEQPSNKKTPRANVKLLRRNTGTDFFQALPGFQTPILEIEYGNRESNGNGNRNANGGELVCKVSGGSDCPTREELGLEERQAVTGCPEIGHRIR
ncbi:hypothetical protein K1719_041620 [Acacia pycnantha]|nr:hypothetical protein K1719_041620 [Acacia pycnantha]